MKEQTFIVAGPRIKLIKGSSAPTVTDAATRRSAPVRGTSHWFDAQQAVLRQRKSRAIKASPDQAEQLTAKFKAETDTLTAVYWVLVNHGLDEEELADQDILSGRIAEVYPALSAEEAEVIRTSNIPSLVAEEFADFVDNAADEDPAAVRQMMNEFCSGIGQFFSATKASMLGLPGIVADDLDDEDGSSDTCTASSVSGEDDADTDEVEDEF